MLLIAGFAALLLFTMYMCGPIVSGDDDDDEWPDGAV